MRILRFRKRPASVPVAEEDSFLKNIRSAVHDWQPIVDEQLRRERLEKKVMRKYRKRALKQAR